MESNYPTWADTWFEICHVVAKRSKDKRTKLGAVIIGPDNELRSLGYNSFPRGINDNKEERQESPEKYHWFEHAERNAIYNACRTGTPLKGCTLYVPLTPCCDCARAIIQAGITKVAIETSEIPEHWDGNTVLKSIVMFNEAGVDIYYHKKEKEKNNEDD